MAGVLAQLPALPRRATLAITASPARGLDASVALAERLRGEGFEVVVHLAARMVADRSHLRRLLVRLRRGDLDRVFVIGGDAPTSGAYPDGLSLLHAMAELGHHFREIGIGCHPQGHPRIPDDRLLEALQAKAPFAHYMTTQLCFDAGALSGWVAARRRDGLELPVDIGVPGAIETAKLLLFSARVGVADASRFIVKYGSLVARLLRPGGYRPDRLLTQLAPMLADPRTGVRGMHVYTFNQLQRTEGWRRQYLAGVTGTR
jgi:methylenetetrahydrofolate reductase (NADPH)